MPSTPPRACRCGVLVPAGKRCPNCTKAYDRSRGSPASRGYDAEWRVYREDFLRRYPTCCIKGCGQPATDVDHIVALRDGGPRFDPANCRPMCHPHHSQRTGRDQVPRRDKGDRGFGFSPRPANDRPGMLRASPARGPRGVSG